MRKYDILKLIYEKKISAKQAYKIYDNVMEFDNRRWIYLLGLTEYEAAAYSFGFKTIARWRYEGWPKKCPLCKRKLIIEKYGWMNKKVSNRRKLVHIDCGEDYLRMLGYTAEDLGSPGADNTKNVTKKEIKNLQKKFKYIFWDQLQSATDKDIKQLKKKRK